MVDQIKNDKSLFFTQKENLSFSKNHIIIHILISMLVFAFLQPYFESVYY